MCLLRTHGMVARMITSFAAGALVVIGILVVALGLFAAGDVLIVLIGLGSIAVGGALGLLGRRSGA
jgi:hypothetical protein